MKKIIIFLWLVAILPLGAQNINTRLQKGIDGLAEKYMTSGAPLYSKATLTITGIKEISPLAKKHFLGEVIKARLIQAVGESLIFRYIDRDNLDDVLAELKLALSDITETNDEIRLGMIETVAFILEGKILENGDSFEVTLELMEVSSAAVVAVTTIKLPQHLLIREGEQYSLQYIVANGLGFSFHWTPHYSLGFSQTPFVEVGDGKTHASFFGGQAAYRLTRNLKIGLNYSIMIGDFFYDGREFQKAKNIPAALLTEALSSDFYNVDGSFSPSSSQTESEIGTASLYYTFSNYVSTIGIPVSFVKTFNRNLAISTGLGPAVSIHQLHQKYDNIPTRFNGGVALKRYEIYTTFIGLGMMANLDAEYFILPRMALNAGIWGHYNRVLPANDIYATSPTHGESYYTTGDVSKSVFGLNPFYRPDGSFIPETLPEMNYFKIYLGISLYF